MNTHRRTRRLGTPLLAAIALTAGLVTPLTDTAAAVEPSPIAHYDFTVAPADARTVENLAGGDLGPALIRNGATFEDDSLLLPGGGKDAGGTWVQLPEDILTGATASTVQAEVRATEDMARKFHFLWNIGNDANEEYYFASLKCATDGRSPLVGLKTSTGERLVQAGAYGCGWTPGEWLSVTAVSYADGDGALYINGAEVARGALGAQVGQVDDQSLNAIARSPWPDELFSGAVSTFRVFDTALDAESIAALSDEDALLHEDAIRAVAEQKLADLEIPESVDDSYLPLPTMQGQVQWSSERPEIISSEGAVTQPSKGAAPVEVTLTASNLQRGISASRDFVVTVQPTTKDDGQVAAELAATYVIPPVLTTDSALPQAPDGFTVEVTGEDGIEVRDGHAVIVGDSEEASGTLVAVLRRGDITFEKRFAVRLLRADSTVNLLAYHRYPTSDREANNADIAYSMHLAMQAAEGWAPLNDNYGIFFARTAQLPTDSVDVRLDVRSLKDPYVFRTADGDFGIVAVRTNRGSANVHPDDPRGAILVATSRDLLSYEEAPNGQSLIELGETNGVNSPTIVFDSSQDRYVVGWKDDAGVAKYTTIASLTHGAQTDGIRLGAVDLGAPASGTGIDDFAGGYAFPVEKSLVDGLKTRFLRVRNTDVEELPKVTVTVGDSRDVLDLPREVELTYSDGSRATKRIDAWEEAALTPALDETGTTFTVPGTYTLTGEINRQAPYPMPFAEDRADPSVYKWEWKQKGKTETKYLMIATNDIDGDVVWQKGTPHMPIRMADSILGLADTPGDPDGLITPQGFNPKETRLLEKGDVNAEGQAITGSFWAPELHEIGGNLSILFMPSYNSNWFDGASAIMQLKKDEQGFDLDPTQPENWTVPKTVTRADGRPLSVNAQGGIGMSLDMTYFQDDLGNSFYVWQQLGATYIATMDPGDPYRITSDPVLIVSPEYAWDNSIAEGPNVLNHDGTLYLLYSGSAVGVTYTTGLAVADASGDADLLDPASWGKLNYPIQKSAIFDGQWQLGTGHGMWSEDEYGELLYVFHAYAPETEGYSNRGGRDMYVRRVHWNADGMPNLEMSADEEVAPGAVAEVIVEVLPADSEEPGEPIEPGEPDPSEEPDDPNDPPTDRPKPTPTPGKPVRPGLPSTGC